MNNIYNFSKYKKTPKNNVTNLLLTDKMKYFELDDKDKYDYETVKTIFDSFPFDYNYLRGVYLDICNNVKEDWTFEFLLRFYDLSKSFVNVKLNDYIKDVNTRDMASKKAEVNILEFEIELRKREYLNALEEIVNDNNGEFGLGFIILKKNFSYSEVILNYLAKALLSKLFLDLDIETYLHTNYESYDEIKGKEKSIIMNIIISKDATLANYIMNHIGLLNELLYVFDYIKDSWNSYINRNMREIYKSLTETLDNYINGHKENYPNNDDYYEFVETTNYVFYFASNEYGILDELYKYKNGPGTIMLDFLKLEFADDEETVKTEEYKYFKQLMAVKLNKVTDIGKRKSLNLQNKKKD